MNENSVANSPDFADLPRVRSQARRCNMHRPSTPQAMKGREFCRAKSLVPYRTLPGEPSSWRTVGDASSRELPSFFLHDSGGANFTSVRSELRRLFRRDGGGPADTGSDCR